MHLFEDVYGPGTTCRPVSNPTGRSCCTMGSGACRASRQHEGSGVTAVYVPIDPEGVVWRRAFRTEKADGGFACNLTACHTAGHLKGRRHHARHCRDRSIGPVSRQCPSAAVTNSRQSVVKLAPRTGGSCSPRIRPVPGYRSPILTKVLS